MNNNNTRIRDFKGIKKDLKASIMEISGKVLNKTNKTNMRIFSETSRSFLISAIRAENNKEDNKEDKM